MQLVLPNGSDTRLRMTTLRVRIAMQTVAFRALSFVLEYRVSVYSVGQKTRIYMGYNCTHVKYTTVDISQKQ